MENTIARLKDNNIEFTQFKNGVIIYADCLDVLEFLEFDHVLTDPPYGITDCKWDIIIDPIDIFNKTIRTKKNSNMIMFGNEPFCTKVRYPNLDLYKYDLIWEKSNSTGFVHAKNSPMRKYENIMVFSTGLIAHENLLKDKRMVYNPQGLIETVPIFRKNRLSNVIKGARPSDRDTISTTKNYPNNILYYERSKNINHHTQKPVSLVSYLTLTYTNENNIILDPFLGSGTLAISVIRVNRETGSNRKFIGIELDKEYYNMACERVAKEEFEYLF